jgi:hypothetical protein
LFNLSTSIGLGGIAGFTSGSGYGSIANGLTTGVHLGFSGCKFVADLLDLIEVWVFFNWMSMGAEFV